jgi:hypothetical protein
MYKNHSDENFIQEISYPRQNYGRKEIRKNPYAMQNLVKAYPTTLWEVAFHLRENNGEKNVWHTKALMSWDLLRGGGGEKSDHQEKRPYEGNKGNPAREKAITVMFY